MSKNKTTTITTKQQYLTKRQQNNNKTTTTTTTTTTTNNNNQQQPTTTKTRNKPQQQQQQKKITATEQQKTKRKNDMTTKTENEVPENDVDHKAPPSKSECYDLPAIYFSAKFLKFIRIASARAKNTYFRSFEGFQGRWHKSGAFGPQHLPPFLFCWCFQPFYVWGGGWLVFLYLSPPSICSYFSGLLLFMLFSFRFFHSLSLFSFFCCFAVRRKRRKKKENETNEKMTNNKNIKKANQGDKGGIARKMWNTKIKKHNKEEKQNRKQKNRPFVVLVVLGCWPLSGRNLARDKGPKNTMKQGFLLFFLFICWSVIGQANEKNNNKNKTTKTRQQNYKTTKNNTGTKTKQQQ